MKKIALFSALLFSLTIFSQTPKKVLTSKEQELKAQRYIEYLKKQNRKRDSIYKIGQFSEKSYPINNDSEIMKRIFREEKLRSVKKDTLVKLLNEHK
ncbi:hypothetical protein ACSV4D_11055 [Flavobacterium sp. ARAG 55.4]|uniref:hypothetical protein n=1 Tax=Flavobacterium sp. ARAG 55.4 TaxID=3451357 RepID=UPI003F45EB5F